MHFSKYILFVIFVFERRTDKRYRCKFPRVTTYNVIDIISHHQCVSIVPHRFGWKPSPNDLRISASYTGACAVISSKYVKVKHIAQFGKFACDIANIFIAGFTAKLRSNDKNTRIWLDRFKFANDFAHIAEKRIGVILRTFCVNVLDASQRMSADKRIVVAQRNDIRLIPLPK